MNVHAAELDKELHALVATLLIVRLGPLNDVKDTILILCKTYEMQGRQSV